FQFKEALKRFMDLARFANKYFNDKEPWVTRKSASEVCATTLNLCVQTAAALSTLMYPVLPFTSEKIWKMLNLPGGACDAAWDEAGDKKIPEGHAIGELQILFNKIEDSLIQQEIDKLKKSQKDIKQEKEPVTEELITIEDFQKVELKTARIISAEAIPKADKLLKLQIDLGDEERQLVAGIAQHYQPEELVGKTIIVVANLQPAVIRGVESRGMLLAVQDGNRLVLVTADGEVAPGKVVS
ncbi:MAG: methionine--tRNA ligase subunit beta, partial [Calditrichia bacterium]